MMNFRTKDPAPNKAIIFISGKEPGSAARAMDLSIRIQVAEGQPRDSQVSIITSYVTCDVCEMYVTSIFVVLYLIQISACYINNRSPVFVRLEISLYLTISRAMPEAMSQWVCLFS